MNLKKFITSLFLLGQTVMVCKANAVCLDPTTFIPGYKEPLALEVRAADGIVIGRVLSARGLSEDPDDPDGFTAYKLTVRVLTNLKGNLPKVIVIRNENTSSRYPMSIGEEHLLFVSKDSQELRVNSCGNSSAMPEGRQLVKQIQAELQRLK